MYEDIVCMRTLCVLDYIIKIIGAILFVLLHYVLLECSSTILLFYGLVCGHCMYEGIVMIDPLQP